MHHGCRIASVLLGATLAVSPLGVFAGASEGAAAASPNSSGSHNLASAPGITPTTITVGLLTSVTGFNASNYPGASAAAQARFDLQNAHGGVNGRKLELVTGDDESSPSGVTTAMENLVANKNAFAVLADTGLFFLGARYLQQNGIPVVGSDADGNEWFTEPNTNMFTFSPSDRNFPQYTGIASLMKSLGVTNVASFGYAISPSSTAGAKGFALSAQKEGLKVGYLNTSVPLNGVNVTADALAMKSSGINALYLPLGLDTSLALMVAAEQAGIHLKAAFFGSGYGSTVLNQPDAVQALQGAYFDVSQTPVELNTPATKIEQDALRKYAHFTGIPDYGRSQAWLAADLFIRGLEAAGRNPTRQSYIAALRKVKNYTGGGLLSQPVTFSQAFGNVPSTSCSYVVQLKGTTFVPTPRSGKPVCGTLIPNSEQG